MFALTRPRLALALTVAALPVAVATPVALAQRDAAVRVPLATQLDPVVALLLSLLSTLSPSALTSALAGLTPPQVTQLLGAATPAQLTNLLPALSTGQLTSGLAGLTPPQLSSLLAGLTGSNLTTVIALLTPAQITSLLGVSPSAGMLNSLLPQVTTLLSGGLPAGAGQLAPLNTLLATLTPLLGTSGLDPSALTSLLTTAQAALASAAPGVDTSALTSLISTLKGVLGLVGSGSGPGSGSGSGLRLRLRLRRVDDRRRLRRVEGHWHDRNQHR